METSIVQNTLSIIRAQLAVFAKEHRRVFATSSFQTQSVPLLHIIGQNFPEVKVLFLDTGFLFPETYAFKHELESLFKLKVRSLKSNINLLQQRNPTTNLFQYSLNPDYCCYINKVQPLEDFLNEGDVWISGVRRDQTAVRKQMNVVETDSRGIIKLHPMLDWTGKDIYEYINQHQLPKHPLDAAGYVSIGCIPCTHKWDGTEERGGRWVGSKKTECGLHTRK